MTSARRRPDDADNEAVRTASRVVGLQITIASGALVLAVLGAAYFFILDQLRPAEATEAPLPGESKIYIDSVDAMVAFIVIGIIAVVIAGVLALVFTRRAVSPIGRALRIQRAFVQDASHELRTPLTVLDSRLQVLQRGLAADDPVAPVVAELRADTKTLIDIVNDLLLAADSAGDAANSHPEPVGPAVEAAVAAMQVLAHDRGIRIDATIEPGLSTTVPPTSMRRCTTALLDNAIGHSPDGSAITVTVERHRGSVRLTVEDAGTGIHGIDPERIFDRFAHSDRPAAAASGHTGFGIGLSLVQDIAARHGGSVDVRDTSENGTTIALTLPFAAEAAH